jgi:hypothetical protein
MTQSEQKNTQWLVYRYVSALDTGNLDEVEKILQVARNNAELDRIIIEINRAFAEEMGLTPIAQAVEKVRSMVAQYFSSPAEIDWTPLTVGDVAAHMSGDQDLSKDLRETSKSLLRNPTALPEMLGLREIQKLAARIKIADEKFWHTFRDVALQMIMGRGQAQMVATRSRRSRKSSPKKNSREKPNEVH